MKRLDHHRIIKLYSRGLSIWKIAKRLECSGTGVWKVLKRMNIPILGAKLIKPWARQKRGEEYLGADGRWWVRPVGGGRRRRAVYLMEKALGFKIPKGFHVHHSKGDPANDDLLELRSAGSHARHHQLNKPNPKKGRKGEAHSHKLTNRKVRRIRRLYKSGWRQQALADRFRVHQTLISAIVTRRSWSHI